MLEYLWGMSTNCIECAACFIPGLLHKLTPSQILSACEFSLYIYTYVYGLPHCNYTLLSILTNLVKLLTALHAILMKYTAALSAQTQ